MCLQWKSTGNGKTSQVFSFSLLMHPISSHIVTRLFTLSLSDGYRSLPPPPPPHPTPVFPLPAQQQPCKIVNFRAHNHSTYFQKPQSLFLFQIKPKHLNKRHRLIHLNLNFLKSTISFMQCLHLKIRLFHFDVLL